MRRALITGSAVAGLLALSVAAPALGAGTVTRLNATSQVTYSTASAAAVVVTDSLAGGVVTVTLTEPGIAIGTAPGCTDNGDSVACTFAAADGPRVSSTLSSGNDLYNASATSFTTHTIQDFMGGNDELHGGNVAVFDGRSTGDVLRPGPGTDKVFGNGGDDEVGDGGEGGGELVEGGTGDDRSILLGEDPIGDTFRMGPGRDSIFVRTVAAPPEGFVVDLPAARLRYPAGPAATDVIEGVEDAETEDGNDTLIGTGAANELLGGAGNDRLIGGLGIDLLEGGDGADRLEGRDGLGDRLDGGPQSDLCVTDQLDERAGCETTDLLAVTPFGARVFPADVRPPRCRVSGTGGRKRASTVARKGLAVTLDCDEPGRVAARMLARVRRVGGKVQLAASGDLELASRSARLGRGDKARLRLKTARRLRRLLRRRSRLTVELRVTDRVGNARTLRRKLRLR